jgi:acetoin utilization protein AcuB
MKVADCMTPEPRFVAPDATLTTAIALMDAGDFRTVPVLKDGKLVGIITDRDIRKFSQNSEATKVSAAMTQHPICVSPDDSVAEAVRMLLAYKVGGLPVVKKHKLVGILTTTDILKAVLGLPELEK